MPIRPLPHQTKVTAPFWDGCNRSKLLLQRCSDAACGKFVFYPRVCCPYCHGGNLEWREASGNGRILTYTLVHRPQHEAFYPEAPVTFIAVALDEGPLIYSQLLDRASPDEKLIGKAVRASFVEVAPGARLPYFSLNV
jgi:uncharacterized OB-fold protein